MTNPVQSAPTLLSIAGAASQDAAADEGAFAGALEEATQAEPQPAAEESPPEKSEDAPAESDGEETAAGATAAAPEEAIAEAEGVETEPHAPEEALLAVVVASETIVVGASTATAEETTAPIEVSPAGVVAESPSPEAPQGEGERGQLPLAPPAPVEPPTDPNAEALETGEFETEAEPPEPAPLEPLESGATAEEASTDAAPIAATTTDPNRGADSEAEGVETATADETAQPVEATAEQDTPPEGDGDRSDTPADETREAAPAIDEAPEAPEPAVADATRAESAEGDATTTNQPNARIERAGAASAASAARETESAPTVDPARFVTRVARAIDFANERGGGPIEMRLSPPELGSLQVKIELKEGAMTASFEAETPAARQALLDNLPALRERLEQQQIRIEKFDVDVRDDSQSRGGEGRPEDQSRQSADERQAQRQSRGVATPTTDSEPTAEARPVATIDFGDDAINLVA